METSPVKKIQPLARGSLRMQSDKRLVKLFRRGLDPAFDELVGRYRASLVSFAGAIAGRDRADDVVQDALVKAYRSLGKDQPIEFKPWLYAVVRNTALNEIRDNQKHDHGGLVDVAGRTEQPHEAFERREELAAVVAAVSDLPESQRQALVGRELGGFSHEEIAQQMRLSTGATKQLIYRARLTLRNAVGALIPVPLIDWLVSDATSVYVVGVTGGAAAGGVLSAASGGVSAVGAASCGGGGVLTGIAGTNAAKLAVATVIATGSVAAGIAVQGQEPRAIEPSVAAAANDERVSTPEGPNPQPGAGAAGGADESSPEPHKRRFGKGKGDRLGSAEAERPAANANEDLRGVEQARSGSAGDRNNPGGGSDRPSHGGQSQERSQGAGQQGGEGSEHREADRPAVEEEPVGGGSDSGEGGSSKPERPQAGEDEPVEQADPKQGTRSLRGDRAANQ